MIPHAFTLFVIFSLFFNFSRVDANSTESSSGLGNGIIPSQAIDLLRPEKVEILTLGDDGKTKKNDPAQFELCSDGLVFFYKFKDGAKCVMLGYSGSPVWQLEQGREGHPKVFCLHSDLGIVFLEFEDSLRMYKLTQRNNGFISALISERNLDGFGPAGNLALTVLDDNGNPQTLSPNTDICAENCHGFEYVYEFKDGVKCVGASYKGQVVWQHEAAPGTPGTQGAPEQQGYPKFVVLNIYTKMIIVDYRTHYLIYQFVEDNVWRFVVKSSLAAYSKYDLKFYDTEDRKISKYKLVEYLDGFTYVYAFETDHQGGDRYGTACAEVRYKDVTVWKQDPRNPVTVESVYVNLSERMLMISGQGTMLVYMYFDEWRKIFSYPEETAPTHTTTPGPTPTTPIPEDVGPKEGEDKSLRSGRVPAGGTGRGGGRLGIKQVSVVVVIVLLLIAAALALWLLRGIR